MSRFIKSMHPKSEIAVDPLTIRRILSNGWWGQLKIHGHRAQIHIPADPSAEILVYTRQGKGHAKAMGPLMVSELRRLLTPSKDWSIVEAEWLKGVDRLFLFDYLKKDGESLEKLSYEERWLLLPKEYISPVIETLGILKTAEECLAVFADPSPHIEGLVFKARKSPGFSNHSIIRCRKLERRI